MATRYVLGFAFTPDLKQVVLVTKGDRSNVPGHAGKLNGVGGKVETIETPDEAMQREGWEEAGLEPRGKWSSFGNLHGTANVRNLNGDEMPVPYEIRLFACLAFGIKFQDGDEPARVYDVKELANEDARLTPNMLWLVHMALRHMRYGTHFDVSEY